MAPETKARAVLALQVIVVMTVATAVWAIGFSGRDSVDVLPTTEVRFSLDLEVIDDADHEVIYAVEQRARPNYRIFSFDPVTGDTQTIYTVPDDAIIYGIALNHERQTLAVSYSPDFALEGSGIWTLDVSSGQFDEHLPVAPGRYLTDLAWSPGGNSVLATQIDRRDAEETVRVVRVDAETAEVEPLVDDAINPIQVDDAVYYLTIDENNARRSIGLLLDGEMTTLDVGNATYDLDHLLAGVDGTSVRVAVIDQEDVDTGGLSFGLPAAAHGNHDVPSSWWSIDTVLASEPTPLGLEPIIVYDAAANGEALIYATNEGLAIGQGSRTDLIKSRAIRFVAG